MFNILIFITALGFRAHGVTPQTRADLARLRGEARILLAGFEGGPGDTPDNHRRGVKRLVDRLVDLDHREWVDPQVRELLETLDQSVTLSIARAPEDLLRHQQIWNLFWFVAKVGEICDGSAWRRTRDASILVGVTAAAVENVSKADPRRTFSVEAEMLEYLHGEISSSDAPEMTRFLALAEAARGDVTSDLRRALFWRLIQTYFDLEDRLDRNCATSLVATTPAESATPP